MLESLYIRNFRLFKELSIEHLGHVNLIVGRNNSGKSCLLEALYIYAQNAFPPALNEIVEKRGEKWELQSQRKKNRFTETENPFRHLFYGYHFPEAGKDPIEIGPLHNITKRLKLHISAYQRIENEDGRIYSRVDEKLLSNTESDNIECFIELERHGRLTKIASLSDRSERYYDYLAREMINVQLVPVYHLSKEQASLLWDNINIQPDLRQEVFKGLRLIDERIREVVKVGEQDDITFILIYNDSDEKLPLSSLGDGMTHLFHIILGLVNAKEGLLLIDEFENGLHYEIHADVWKLIFSLAKQLEVQVFATTHSGDCVSAFQETAGESETEGVLFNLSRSVLKSDAGKVIATPYNKEKLQLADQAQIEVR